jgi:large subunit ribosomal protein L29
MKNEEIKKWRESSEEELRKHIEEKTVEMYKLRNQINLGQLKNFSLLGKAKKEVAVMKTLLREREIAGDNK